MPFPNLPPIVYTVIASIISLFVGAIINGYVIHRRDKRVRKRDYIAMLHGWRSEINVVRGTGHLNVTEFIYHASKDKSAEAYYARRFHFVQESQKVRDCFADAVRFQLLTTRLGGLNDEDWKGKQAKDVILGPLDELITFAESRYIC